MYDVAPVDLKPDQKRPVEISPGPKLEIDERGQYQEDDRIDNIFFRFHAVRRCKALLWSASPQLKVNERVVRVNVGDHQREDATDVDGAAVAAVLLAARVAVAVFFAASCLRFSSFSCAIFFVLYSCTMRATYALVCWNGGTP